MNNQTGELIAGLFGLALVIALVFFIGFLYWRIASKAGFSGALGLLMFVPLVNMIMIIFFAFSEWPIMREVKELRMNQQYGKGDYQSQLRPSQQPPQF